MTDSPSPNNIADDSQRGLVCQKVVIECGMPAVMTVALGIAIAICLSITGMIFGYECNRKMELNNYYSQRTEAFLEQLSFQGTRVPCDILPHNKECKQ